MPLLPVHDLYASGAVPLFSLGSSSAIYALIATALIWAPENDSDGQVCFIIIRYTTIPIKAAAAIYFGLDLLDFIMFGFQVSSGLLHLMGAAFGFPFAIFMLQQGWVDCEGWDIFSQRGEEAPAASEKKSRLGKREQSNEGRGRPLPAGAANQSNGVAWGWDNLK